MSGRYHHMLSLSVVVAVFETSTGYMCSRGSASDQSGAGGRPGHPLCNLADPCLRCHLSQSLPHALRCLQRRGIWIGLRRRLAARRCVGCLGIRGSSLRMPLRWRQRQSKRAPAAQSRYERRHRHCRKTGHLEARGWPFCRRRWRRSVCCKCLSDSLRELDHPLQARWAAAISRYPLHRACRWHTIVWLLSNTSNRHLLFTGEENTAGAQQKKRMRAKHDD